MDLDIFVPKIIAAVAKAITKNSLILYFLKVKIMPKYTVEEVLNIVKTFTIEERKALQNQLPAVLNSLDLPAIKLPTGRNQQSQSFGNVTLSGSNAFDVNQIASEGAVNLAHGNKGQVAKAENQEVLDLLHILKQGIANTEKMNVLEKKNAESTISVIEEELDKPKPDKSLLSQAGEALKVCCKNVAEFAEPALSIANIIAMIV